MSRGESAGSMMRTPLWRRLRAVMLAYRTRPLTWVALVVYLLAIAGVVHNLHDPRPPFEAMLEGATPEARLSVEAERVTWESQRRLSVAPRERTPSPRLYFAPPQVAQSFNRDKKILPKDVRTVSILDQEYIPDDFWQPGRYPRVEAVINFGPPLQPEIIQKLLETYPLKSLILHRNDVMTIDDFRQLAQAESLEELSLADAKVLSDPAEMEWPRSLRSLTLSVYHPLPLARLQEWRQLPQLKSLILDIPADLRSKVLTSEIIAELDQFPQRPTLFLGDTREADGESALAMQPLFQKLAVRPRRVPKVRLTAAMYAYLLLLIPTAFGIYQLATQSLQPLMILAPGTRRPHQAFAAACWIAGSLVAVLLLMICGVQWSAALALAASGVLSYIVLQGLMQHSRGIEQVGFAHPVIVVLPLMLIGIVFGLGAALLHFYPPIGGEIDWFLRGRYPFAAVSVALAGPVAAAILLRKIVRIQRAAQEVGVGQVPMSALDWGGWNTAAAPIVARKFDTALRVNPVMRARERRIEAALNQGPALTRSQRVRVWMCGVHAHPLDMTFMVTLIGLLQFVVFQGLRNNAGEFRLERTALITPAIQILMMFLMLPLMSLWIRRRWMPQESLYPLSRSDWRRDWYAVQAYMLVPIPVMLTVLAMLDWWLGGVINPSRLEMFWGGLAIVAAIIATWALSLIVVTLRTSSLLIMGTVVVAIFLTVITLGMLSRAWPGLDDAAEAAFKSPSAPLVAVILVAALLAALFFWARQRWSRWEVGRLS